MLPARQSSLPAAAAPAAAQIVQHNVHAALARNQVWGDSGQLVCVCFHVELVAHVSQILFILV